MDYRIIISFLLSVFLAIIAFCNYMERVTYMINFSYPLQNEVTEIKMSLQKGLYTVGYIPEESYGSKIHLKIWSENKLYFDGMFLNSFSFFVDTEKKIDEIKIMIILKEKKFDGLFFTFSRSW